MTYYHVSYIATWTTCMHHDVLQNDYILYINVIKCVTPFVVIRGINIYYLRYAVINNATVTYGLHINGMVLYDKSLVMYELTRFEYSFFMYIKLFTVSIISRHWNGEGIKKPSSLKKDTEQRALEMLIVDTFFFVILLYFEIKSV